MLAIEARDAVLTVGNGEASRGEEGAVEDCPPEGMNLSKCTLRGRPLNSYLKERKYQVAE
jgi:hypothetical protein